MIELQYGKEKSVSFTIDRKNLYFIADRNSPPKSGDSNTELIRALRKPTLTPALSRMVAHKKSVVIVVDDIARPTPQKVILPILLNELNTAGIPDSRIKIIVALGTHRRMSEAELKIRYGTEVYKRILIENHDYKDPNKLVNIGNARSGIPVTINKAVWNADFVIGIGNIAPHPYVGWSGGGKIILPGVSGEETVGLNHITATKIKPMSKLLGKMDNIVRYDINEISIKAGLRFIVNTILNQRDDIFHIVAGHPIEAFRRGVAYAEKIFLPKIPGYADIIIVSSYPFDIDYWQASKALAFASAAVKPQGTIILVTPCPEGISTSHPEMGKRAALTYEENLNNIENGKIHDLVAGPDILIHSQIVNSKEVICYSDGLTEKDKEALKFKHAKTINEAVEMALESQGKDAKVGILKNGEIIPQLATV